MLGVSFISEFYEDIEDKPMEDILHIFRTLLPIEEMEAIYPRRFPLTSIVEAFETEVELEEPYTHTLTSIDADGYKVNIGHMAESFKYAPDIIVKIVTRDITRKELEDEVEILSFYAIKEVHGIDDALSAVVRMGDLENVKIICNHMNPRAYAPIFYEYSYGSTEPTTRLDLNLGCVDYPTKIFNLLRRVLGLPDISGSEPLPLPSWSVVSEFTLREREDYVLKCLELLFSQKYEVDSLVSKYKLLDGSLLPELIDVSTGKVIGYFAERFSRLLIDFNLDLSLSTRGPITSRKLFTAGNGNKVVICFKNTKTEEPTFLLDYEGYGTGPRRYSEKFECMSTYGVVESALELLYALQPRDYCMSTIKGPAGHPIDIVCVEVTNLECIARFENDFSRHLFSLQKIKDHIDGDIERTTARRQIIDTSIGCLNISYHTMLEKGRAGPVAGAEPRAIAERRSIKNQASL